MTNHTKESRYMRDRNQRRVPREEWIITEGTHEAIVTKEEYEAAQAQIRVVKKHKRKPPDGSGCVFFCGHCGRKLRKSFGLDTYFACDTQLYREYASCADIRWSKTDLEAVLQFGCPELLKQIFGAEYSIIEEEIIEVEELWNLTLIRAEGGTRVKTTVASVGDASKTINVFADSQLSEQIVSSSSIGIKVNAGDLLGAQVRRSTDGVSLSLSTTNENKTDSITLIVDGTKMEVGFEGATTIKSGPDGATETTAYQSVNVTGSGILVLFGLALGIDANGLIPAIQR